MPKRKVVPKAKPLHIFIVAEQFRLAGKLATLAPKMAHIYREFEFVRDQNMLQSSFVCAALSLELYFKCLIRMSRKSYKQVHWLDELFKQMGKSHRATIKRYFCANSQVTREYFEKEYPDRKTSDSKLFEFCLCANRDAFRAMRYVYEEDIIEEDTGWIGGDVMVEAARNRILEKHPEWEGVQQKYSLAETAFRQPTYQIR
jgi:HEPN domain-containing protein